MGDTGFASSRVFSAVSSTVHWKSTDSLLISRIDRISSEILLLPFSSINDLSNNRSIVRLSESAISNKKVRADWYAGGKLANSGEKNGR